MYREVTMIEIREVLRLRGEGLPKKRIAAQLGLDPKTVRRYLGAAATAGVGVTPTVSADPVFASTFEPAPPEQEERPTAKAATKPTGMSRAHEHTVLGFLG